MIGLFITLCFLVVRNISGQRSAVPQFINSQPLPVLPLDYRPPYREFSRRYDDPQESDRVIHTSVLPLEAPKARTNYDQPQIFPEPYPQLQPYTVPPLNQQGYSDYIVPPSRTTEREIPLVQSESDQHVRTNSNLNSEGPSINISDTNSYGSSSSPQSSVKTKPVDIDVAKRVYNYSSVGTDFNSGSGIIESPETTLRKNEPQRRLFISRTITRTMNRGDKNSTDGSVENSSDANSTVNFEDKPAARRGNGNPVNTTHRAPTTNRNDVTTKPQNTTAKPNVPEITLDERASFEADQCPKGYVKVNGMCVEAD